jgi:hypothetical protein
MKKILFSLAVLAMTLGFVSCEPITNESNPLLGLWAIEGNDTRTIEFDQENAMVTIYDQTGEVYRTNYYEYIIQRKKVFFALYTADLQLYVHECDYRTDGDNSVIITGLNPILYYGTSTDSSYNPTADVVLIKK